MKQRGVLYHLPGGDDPLMPAETLYGTLLALLHAAQAAGADDLADEIESAATPQRVRSAAVALLAEVGNLGEQVRRLDLIADGLPDRLPATCGSPETEEAVQRVQRRWSHLHAEVSEWLLAVIPDARARDAAGLALCRSEAAIQRGAIVAVPRLRRGGVSQQG